MWIILTKTKVHLTNQANYLGNIYSLPTFVNHSQAKDDRKADDPLYSPLIHRYVASFTFYLRLGCYLMVIAGYNIPRLGFGLYQNDDAEPAILEALKAGYQ